MKRLLKTAFALTMTALILALSCATAFAAKGDFTVNGANAKVGDKITYTLNLSDCTEKIEGLQMYVAYDSKYLKIDPESLDFPKLSGVVSNTELEDTIAFNWTDVQKTADFSKKGKLLTVDFEVVKEGDAEITYFVSELYGNDLTYLKSFTFTNDVAVNGKTVVKNASAIVCRDSKIIDEYQGSFTNYADAKGEKNGSGKDAIVGVTKPATVPGATEVTKDSGSNITTIITILVIAAIVIAIIIVAVLRRHFTKSEPDENK